MEREYIGVEIDGTDQTLSKDARVTFLPNGTVELGVCDAYDGWRGDFTGEQFDALLDMLIAARDMRALAA